MLLQRIFLLALLVAVCEKIHAVAVTATIIGRVSPIPGVITEVPYTLLLDSATYTKGGLVYNFPAGTFAQPPLVKVSLNWNGYTTGITYSATVTAVTADSCTIRVNKSGLLLGLLSVTVAEADTSDVVVVIEAIGI